MNDDMNFHKTQSTTNIPDSADIRNTTGPYLPFMKNLADWATFKAIIDIIAGALSCLGIITAAYGVPKIISGVKLLNASEDMKKFITTNDSYNINIALYNLNRYFKLSGIAIIIEICFVVLGIVFYIAAIAYIFTHIPDFFNNLPKGGKYF